MKNIDIKIANFIMKSAHLAAKHGYLFDTDEQKGSLNFIEFYKKDGNWCGFYMDSNKLEFWINSEADERIIIECTSYQEAYDVLNQALQLSYNVFAQLKKLKL